MANAVLAPALNDDALQELTELLADLGSRSDDVPPWEFCDGFLAALVCTRRPIDASQWLPVLLGGDDGWALAHDVHGALEQMQPFADLAQQQRFLELCQMRCEEVARQLDTEVESLEDERAYAPEVFDWRGAMAALPPEERDAAESTQAPAFAQPWALGFLYMVQRWSDDWAEPRDRKQRAALQDALGSIARLASDDVGTPKFNFFDEKAPPSISEERVERFFDANWAVYELHLLWRSLGPRTPTIYNDEKIGRNDPCPCGSGKKYKKCCGA